MEAVFENGDNPYLACVRKNLAYLERIKRDGDWSVLRRRPPCIVPDPNGEAQVMMLALRRLRELSDTERENSRRLRGLNVELYCATRPSPT